MIGREAELGRILEAICQEHAHVVLFSDRGWGKTSLANLAVEELRAGGITVIRHICEAGSTFDSIMRGLLRSLPASMLALPARPDPAEGCEAALPIGELRPQDVASLPSRLSIPFLVCVIDEFDRIEDTVSRTRFADTMKQVSDRDLPIVFMTVGVSENLEEIVGQHGSIQRNLAAIPLPLLSDQQVQVLVAAGAEAAGIAFPPDILDIVVRWSRGLPYMAQLLGLRLTQAVSGRAASVATEADLTTVATRLVAEGRPHVATLYDTLTQGGADPIMQDVLCHLASASHDAFGRLHGRAEADGAVAIDGYLVPAHCWSQLLAARVLEIVPGPGSHTLVVRERALLQHVMLRAALHSDAPFEPQRLHAMRADL